MQLQRLSSAAEFSITPSGRVLCVRVYLCLFIKLHITAQSGPVVLVIICPSPVCVCVCVFIKLHMTAQSGPVILVILCHSH